MPLETIHPSLATAQRLHFLDEMGFELADDHEFAMQPTGIIRGIGPLAEVRLERLGIRTVQDLTDASETDIVLVGKRAMDVHRALLESVREKQTERAA